MATKPKIMALTPEQEAELPKFRQRYLDIASNGGRIDRPALESALADAYAVIGKPAPTLFIFDSPAACMIALKIFDLPKGQLGGHLWDQLRGQLRDQLWDQLGGQLGGHLWDQLRGQLRDQLWDQLGDQLGDQLRGQLRDQLWDQLGDHLWGQLRGQLRDQLWDQLRDQLWDQLRDQNIFNGNYLWGSQDFYWVAWGRFAQTIGVELRPDTAHRLEIMERIGTQCEWWWPYENIVVACERPKVRWDGEGRLHNEIGPAVEYSDGYGLYAWRGIGIPAEWITDGPPPAEKIMRIENVEQRRIAAEMRGWHNVIPALPDAKLIDKHANPQVGELWQATLPDHGAERFLQVKCGTGRTFAIPVGMEFATAREANAATYQIPVELLDALEVRT